MPFFTKKRTVTLEIYNLALFVTAPLMFLGSTIIRPGFNGMHRFDESVKIIVMIQYLGYDLAVLRKDRDFLEEIDTELMIAIYTGQKDQSDVVFTPLDRLIRSSHGKKIEMVGIFQRMRDRDLRIIRRTHEYFPLHQFIHEIMW